MTEFLDGVKDGVKGEVCDLTSVNFDAMELRKLLAERNAWANRIKKLEDGKSSVSAEIWKKLRGEYDQKLKARENELITVRERMRKRLDEMAKLKESIEKEFPSLHKRREELNLRFQLGDFNQEFFDYVNAELSFQIDVRQKKVEVLTRNVAFYRESLALEDAPAGGKERGAAGESAESEGFGKGGGSGGVATPTAGLAPHVVATPRTPLPEAAPAPEIEEVEEEPPRAWSVPAEDAQIPEEDAPTASVSDETLEVSEDEAAAEVAPTGEMEEPTPDGAEAAPSPAVAYVDVPAEEADLDEDEGEEEELAPAVEPEASPANVEEADGISYTEEVSSLDASGVEELEEEIEEDLAVEGEATPAPYLDSLGAEEEGSLDTEEQLNALTIDEDIELPPGAEDLADETARPSLPGPGRRRTHTGLHPDQEIELGEPTATHLAPTPAMVSRTATPSQVEGGIAAMSEISNVFARGAQSDPEREEAKKILEEVNLEELERAVEGIESDGDDEELRGFARDVSGRRGEGTAPPPAVLEVVEGVNLGKVFPLSRTSNVTSIGKAPDNTIALPEDKALSRYHAKVIFRNGKFVIMDLDSTNGTGVNGEAITEADLQDEDEIIMGGARYVFRITARS